MSYAGLSQSWKNVTKITTAGALAAALAFCSGPAKAGGIISSAHASATPPATPYSSQPSFNQSFCPEPAKDELTHFYTLGEAFNLSLKDGGQYVFVAGDDADMALVQGKRDGLRERGYCVEVARVRSEGKAAGLRGVVIVEYGTAHLVQFNNREIATGALGGNVMLLHEDNGRDLVDSSPLGDDLALRQ